MIEIQDGESLVFWAEPEIASLTPEFRNRWRAVHRDGRVAHRPSRPGPGPWVSLGNALVSPRWLTRTEEGWRDPAGFLFDRRGLRLYAHPCAFGDKTRKS